MDTEGLYEEVPCRRCGRMKLRLASVCPHCGDVKEETWWDRLKQSLSGRTTAGGEGPGLVALLPVLLALAIAGYVAYQALVKGSYQNLVAAAILLFLALRGWFGRRSGQPRRSSSSEKSSDGVHPTSLDLPGPHFSCENCGATVGEKDAECPRCGMRFGP